MTADDRPRPHEAASADRHPITDPEAPRDLRRLGADAACVLLLFCGALLWFGLTLDRTLHMTDEGYLLRMGQRVAQGELPHRDFVEDYGPGVFVAIGAIIDAGDGEIVFIRRALAVWKALAVVLGFACARLLTPRWVAFGVGLLSIVFWGRASLNVNAPHAAVLTIPICMAATLLMAIGAKRGRAAEARRWLFASGLLCGLAVLFKQSLGVMNAYALTLAVAGSALAGLDTPDRADPDARPAMWPWLLAWGFAGLALLVPGARYLGLTEYLTHIAAIHAAMACVAVALWQRGLGVPLGPFIRTRAVPFALGGIAPLVIVAAYYGFVGHLDELWTGMFERPFRRRNYATPPLTPPPGIALFVIGALAVGAGAARELGRRPRVTSIVSAGIGLTCMVVAVGVVPRSNPDLYTPAILVRSASIFDWVLHTGILAAAVLLFGPVISRSGGARSIAPDERARLRALLPLFFFSALLCFQVFPRGAHNAWMAHAAWMPLLGVVLHEAGRRLAKTAPRLAPQASRPGSARARRIALVALILVIPTWLAWPVAARTWRRSGAPTRALDLPKTADMHVRIGSIARWHLAEVEALVAHLDQQPDGPLLLIGGDVMLHYLTDRPPLRPEYEYATYNVVLDMLPLRELAELEDGHWVEALRSRRETVVVVERDESSGRVFEALPSLTAHLRARYQPAHRFGVYEVWEPVAGRAGSP